MQSYLVEFEASINITLLKPYIVYTNQILCNFKEVLTMCTKHDDDPFGVQRPDIVLVNKLSYIYKIQKDNLITHRSHIFFTFVHTNSEFLADVQSFSLLFTLFNVRAYVITWCVRRFLIGCLRSKRGGQSRFFSARIQWLWWDRTVTFDWYPRYLHKVYNTFLSKYTIPNLLKVF